ncbi:putative hydrolase [Polystyrenella longa]|uniref:Putative hydrolase n=1 Tax=Polystyrenella longa TaxID=2528007 RepID=A0A518CLB9_9PLAN|nr:alpha/beta fold hydrolase [Polystyrenella longa]QDU80016.1 putative hydrolase [Polystyrenella longa]
MSPSPLALPVCNSSFESTSPSEHDAQEQVVTIEKNEQRISEGTLPLGLPDFIAQAPFYNGMMQTVLTWTKRIKESALNEFNRRPLNLPIDDGTGDCLTAELLQPHSDVGANRPLIVLLHGLGGTSQSVYIRSAAHYLCSQGNRVVRLNFRGAGDAAGCCDEIHHPGRYRDLAALFSSVSNNPQFQSELEAGVVLAGFSLGGSVLLNYLAREDLDDRIRGAITISAPLDLKSTSRCLDKPTRWPFQRYLLHKMRHEINRSNVDITPAEEKAIKNARSVWEFDKTFTAPRAGYSDVESYYADNSAGTRLSQINIPTLLLFAKDDPLIDGQGYLNRNWDDNPCLIPAMVPDGGHVGFHASPNSLPDNATRWHEACIHQFVNSLQSTDHQIPSDCSNYQEKQYAQLV